MIFNIQREMLALHCGDGDVPETETRNTATDVFRCIVYTRQSGVCNTKVYITL
jgi:hypothetical protein